MDEIFCTVTTPCVEGCKSTITWEYWNDPDNGWGFRAAGGCSEEHMLDRVDEVADSGHGEGNILWNQLPENAPYSN